MRLKQNLFYRKVGVRQRAHLTRPRMIPIAQLELPFESIYHFNPTDTVSVGPAAQDPLFTEIKARVFIEHHTDLTTKEGAPRRTVLNPLMMTNEYRRKHRLFKPLRKEEALLINPRNVLVVNYAMLSALYRYIPSFKAEYFRWFNIASTFWSGVADAHERFKWNQYLDLHLPDVIPTYEQFKRMESGITQRSLEAFSNPAALGLMDIWHWLGNDRERSNLAILSDEALEKINLIIRVKGYFFVMNLGVVDAWRKDEEEAQDTGLAGTVLQRRFITLLHGLRDLISGVTRVGEPSSPTAVSDQADPAETMAGAGKQESPEAEEPEDQTPQAQGEEPVRKVNLPDLDELLLPTPISTPEAPATPVFTQTPNVTDAADPALLLPQEEAEGPLTTEAEPPSLEERLTRGVVAKAWELHDVGMMSGKAYQRTLEEAQQYRTLKDPFGSGRTMEEMLQIDPEDLAMPETELFPDRDTIPDKSMLSSKLSGMQRKYIQNVMQKDILNAVMAVQTQGVSVKNYTIETERDAMNHYQVHTVTLKPVRGRQSTIRFRLPVIDKDGRFISNGITCTQKLQRADVPIRKVRPDRVALTSYYNKTFVDRSSRKVNDYDRWLCNEVTAIGLNTDDERISGIKFSNVFQMTEDLPRIYSLLAKRFVSFKAGEVHLFFNYPERVQYLEAIVGPVNKLETAGQVLCGHRDGQAVLVDGNGTFYVQAKQGLEVLGNIYDLTKIDSARAPLEVIEMTVANKVIPVGFVLAYQLGLTDLIKYLGCEVNRFRRGERNIQSSDEYAITFQDEVLVFSRLDTRSSMILAGLNRYHNTLKQYSVWDFDRKDVYHRLLSDMGMGVRYLREIEAVFASWVDPITRGLLEEMGEPTEFQPLLLRAVELLMTDFSPEEVDGAYMRYRGYERMAGAVYGELIRAAKTFNARAGVGEHAVELNPYAVWQRVVQDPSVGIVEERNPLQDLREQEAMTYRGDGGRSGKSMVERTRIYHNSDVGVVSESTQDSGDVGVVAYLSPDANFVSLRGTTRQYNPEADGVTKLFSTSALLAPGAAHDDTKRINFIAIQQSQGVFADGYEPTPLRTGYEQIVAHRTSDLYAASATDDGEVVDVNAVSIVVKYANGEEHRVELGKRHGTGAGVTYPHEVVTEWRKGDKITKGDIIAYNRKFFAPDLLNPGKAVLKAGVMCRTALIDNIDTLEDGSAISERVAKLMNSQTTEVKNIEVRFDQNIHGLVKVGDHVDLETILCTIEDPEAADTGLFDEASMDTLRRLSSMTPRAKVTGTVSRIECFYHGDFEDLSENLQVLARESDRDRKRRAKALGLPNFTGQVDSSFRIHGKSLDPDVMAIRVYIDHDVSMSTGDKAVFANQLKTVISRVMIGKNTDAAGEPLDAIFGNLSIEARMVHSPKLMGTTNTLLRVLSKHVASVYKGEKDGRAK